jgi:hypothetical protein
MEVGVSLPDVPLASRLEWIVGLLQNTIPDLEGPPQALRTLVHHMGTYLRGIRIQCAGAGHGGPHLSVLGEPSIPDELPMRGEDDQKPLNDKLALIQAALQRVLKAFLHPGSPAVPITAEVTVRYSWHAAKPDQLQRDWITNDVREGLRFRLLEDLAQAHDLLRECAREGCGKIFVRHYRQEFCSTSCRNRTNVRKSYQRSKEKRGVTRTPSGAAEPSTRKKEGRTKTETRRAPMK